MIPFRKSCRLYITIFFSRLCSRKKKDFHFDPGYKVRKFCFHNYYLYEKSKFTHFMIWENEFDFQYTHIEHQISHKPLKIKKTTEEICGLLSLKDGLFFNKSFVYQKWFNVRCSSGEIFKCLIQIYGISHRQNIFTETVTIFTGHSSVRRNPVPSICV